MKPENWFPLLIVALLIGAFFNQPLIVIISMSGIAVIGLAQLWKLFSLEGVTYRRRWRYRRGFPGETTMLRIEVENNKLLPLSWLKISDPWPLAVPPEENQILSPSHIPGQGILVNIYSLRWFERITRPYKLVFKQRGVYPVGPAEIQSGDLFGLYEKKLKQGSTDRLTVYPELIPFSSLQLPADDPFGDRQSRRRLFVDPSRPIGVRPYHPEDDFRSVHWSATARTGSLQVKVHQPVSSKVVVVCLNITTTSLPIYGARIEIMEQMIKICATLVHKAYQDGYAVGMVSNGCMAHADQPLRISPGRSPSQPAHLLQALAAVTPYTTNAFETFLYKSMPHIPYGATLLIVTALVPPNLCEAILRLKRYRSFTTLISLDETTPPDLPGIRTVHLPFEA
jgi:uncharacterized protein (DUF58 family)